MLEFKEFSKIGRLSREMVISEKIDGTNASILIDDNGVDFAVASRTRLITPEDDNFGFSRWVHEHKEELIPLLGPGTHFGEWWGSGIQRGYGLIKGEKRFSLFNTGRWTPENKPPCCSVVPVLYTGDFDTARILGVMQELQARGSQAAPGFMKPEGVVIYHTAARCMFKKTFEKDDAGKGRES